MNAVRRIVTGHDERGRAIVTLDTVDELIPRREGVASRVLWTTASVPADNSGDEDASTQEIGLTVPGGTVFRIVEFGPGNPDFVHRTESVDYAVVMDGEIDMELDDGTAVHLWAGDVLVQRGTVHGWRNRGGEPCRIAFVLISANPVEREGRLLQTSIPD